MFKCLVQALALFFLATSQVHSQEFLDAIDDRLTLASEDQDFRVDLAGLLDLELYAPDQPAMGLLNTDDDVFFNPRLTLLFDIQATDHLRGHLQMRTDRGFDPGFAPDGQTRLDEYFIEWKPLEKSLINFRLGKFATAFGAWTQRRLSWDNPFITAPMAYNDMLPVTDETRVSLGGIAGRRNKPDNRDTWLPILWGPSYATGASVFGQVSVVDYVFEVKNAALSSAPRNWDALQGGWEGTTYTGRLGLRPAPEWNLGFSYSHGPYLTDALSDYVAVVSPAPTGSPPDARDYNQTTIGLDLSWSHGPWQVWSEVMTSRFETPNAGGTRSIGNFIHNASAAVRVWSGFVEVKHKLGSQWWVAARWNQSWFNDLPGTDAGWDNDGWRADFSIGHRFSRHLQAKLQYSLAGREDAGREGHHLVAAQITLKF